MAEEKSLPNLPAGWKLNAEFTATTPRHFTGSMSVQVVVETWVTGPEGQAGERAKSTYKCTATEDGNGTVTLTPQTKGPLETKSIWAGGDLHAQFIEMKKTSDSKGYKAYTGKVEAIFAYGGTNGPIVKIQHPVKLEVEAVKKPQGQMLP